LNAKPDLYGAPNSARRKKVHAIIQYSKTHPTTYQSNDILSSPDQNYIRHSKVRTNSMSDNLLDRFKPTGFPDHWIGTCKPLFEIYCRCHL
jgi:hypothetical protein